MTRLEVLLTVVTIIVLVTGYIESHDDFDTSVDSTLIDLDQGGITSASIPR